MQTNLTLLLSELLSRSNVMTQNEFSHQKWMPFAHAEMLMPNNLGFLVEMRVQAHLLAVARGYCTLSFTFP